jgi:hypothetical protein
VWRKRGVKRRMQPVGLETEQRKTVRKQGVRGWNCEHCLADGKKAAWWWWWLQLREGRVGQSAAVGWREGAKAVGKEER